MTTGEECVVRDERQARIALACVTEPGDLELVGLVATEGAQAVWHALADGRSATRWGRRAATIRLDHVRLEMARHNLRFVIPGDAEWPDRLNDLEGTEWESVGGGVPLGLWVTGPGHLAEWVAHSVAIVGSRACTPYGEAVSGDMAAELAAGGATIVSGGAYGIDISAHRGSLAGDGRTVAVLAGGADHSYPRGNSRMLGVIRERGLVVSELPPGERPSRLRFLTRNRIIAALATATVVVEAEHRSGAKNTVTWAEQCLRPVLAVPGPVTSTFSAGTHQLIREGKATLVTNAVEVREVIAPMGQDLLPFPQGSGHVLDGLERIQREVFEAVPGRGGRGAEEVAVRCGQDLLTTLNALVELEERGLIQVTAAGGWRLRAGSVG